MPGERPTSASFLPQQAAEPKVLMPVMPGTVPLGVPPTWRHCQPTWRRCQPSTGPVGPDFAPRRPARRHRDSDYCTAGGQTVLGPYLSFWTARDDAGPDNGGLWIRPGSHLPAAQARAGEQEQGEGVPLALPAGAAVIMHHLVQHRSGANASRHVRRGWMPQFCARPIVPAGGDDLAAIAVPLRPQHGSLPSGEVQGC